MPTYEPEKTEYSEDQIKSMLMTALSEEPDQQKTFVGTLHDESDVDPNGLIKARTFVFDSLTGRVLIIGYRHSSGIEPQEISFDGFQTEIDSP